MRLIYISLPTAVALAVTWGLSAYPVNTDVRISLDTNSLTFTINQSHSSENIGPSLLIRKAEVTSVALSDFERIALKPVRLEVADPERLDLMRGYPKSAWKLLAHESQIEFIRDADLYQPQIDISSPQPNSVELDDLELSQGSIVTITATGGKKQLSKDAGLSVVLTIQPSTEVAQTVIIHKPIEMTVTHCRLIGVSSTPFRGDSFSYKTTLTTNSPLTILSKKSLLLVLTVPSYKADDLFQQVNVPIISPRFTQIDRQSGRVVPGLANAVLTYDDYPKLTKRIRNDEFLDLNQANGFVMEDIVIRIAKDASGMNAETPRIHLSLRGRTARIRTSSLLGSDVGRKEIKRVTVYYVSALEALRQNSILATLFAFGTWGLTTTVAVYKTIAEIKKAQ